ncbi:hypothetical protein [Amycolatopsis methanolica]|uniref:Uncharacterized protein n=1 Tax=Amycolatopsis methanolica 239 TaxID=1068978 RepID=A0A076MYG8_AMYME|nr:hypothetical protein [Amycolatopsis methanolica]AIJ24031.1 hypothetical protein AMETH_3939 [Amycolatopsis methanolica 239]
MVTPNENRAHTERAATASEPAVALDRPKSPVGHGVRVLTRPERLEPPRPRSTPLRADWGFFEPAEPDEYPRLGTAFGWQAHRVDGHDVAALLGLLRQVVAGATRTSPVVIIADTLSELVDEGIPSSRGPPI